MEARRRWGLAGRLACRIEFEHKSFTFPIRNVAAAKERTINESKVSLFEIIVRVLYYDKTDNELEKRERVIWREGATKCGLYVWGRMEQNVY